MPYIVFVKRKKGSGYADHVIKWKTPKVGDVIEVLCDRKLVTGKVMTVGREDGKDRVEIEEIPSGE